MRSAQQRVDPAFRHLIPDEHFAQYEAHTEAVYGIWKDFSLAYFNPSWQSFAEANGADKDFSSTWRHGRSLLEAVPEVLQIFYHALFNCVLEQKVGYTYKQTYDCSTPNTFREYKMSVICLRGQLGLIIKHDITESYSFTTTKQENKIFEFPIQDREGRVMICAHCRKIQRRGSWHRVAEYVRSAPSHQEETLCEECTQKYEEDVLSLPL